MLAIVIRDACSLSVCRKDLFLDFGARCPPRNYDCTNLAVAGCACKSNARRLLGEGSPNSTWAVEFQAQRERAKALRASSRPRPARSLSWDVSANTFRPVRAGIGVICPDPWTTLNSYEVVFASTPLQEGDTENQDGRKSEAAKRYDALMKWPTTVDSMELSAGYGQMLWDSGICDQYKTKWVSDKHKE